MKRGSLSGWQLSNQGMQRKPVMPEGPTRWQMMLYRAGLSEATVLDVIQTEEGKEIRTWIRRYYNSAYVPETILELMKIDTRWSNL